MLTRMHLQYTCTKLDCNSDWLLSSINKYRLMKLIGICDLDHLGNQCL